MKVERQSEQTGEVSNNSSRLSFSFPHAHFLSHSVTLTSFHNYYTRWRPFNEFPAAYFNPKDKVWYLDLMSSNVCTLEN